MKIENNKEATSSNFSPKLSLCFSKKNVLILVISLILFHLSRSPTQPTLLNEDIIESNATNPTADKIIVYWNSYFDAKDWGEGFGHQPFKACKVKNCITTNDHNRYEDSDAMLCHMRSDGCAVNELPSFRKQNQYWIFFLMESVANSASGGQLAPYNGKFNLTLTYKLNSNITHSYGEKEEVINALKDANYQFYSGKTTSVAWIVSNCFTSNSIQGRTTYINELSKFISVKRYGRCPGHTRCGDMCYKEAAKEHKFYFAAENSLCKDYMTEKPWWAIKAGMIPIVYGYGNYSQYLPSHSFIDVRDFPSPRVLAEHLKRVVENKEMYDSYFAWKTDYVNTQQEESYFCELCAFLNQPNPPKSIIHNLDTFWSESSDCINPWQFHKSVMQVLVSKLGFIR